MQICASWNSGDEEQNLLPLDSRMMASKFAESKTKLKQIFCPNMIVDIEDTFTSKAKKA